MNLKCPVTEKQKMVRIYTLVCQSLSDLSSALQYREYIYCKGMMPSEKPNVSSLSN